MRNTLLTVPVLALGFCHLAGCSDDPPAPADVRSRITDDLGNVLRETNAAAHSLDAVPGSAAMAMLDRVLDAQAADAISPRIASKLTGLRATVGARADVRTADDGTSSANGEDLIDTDETVRFLTEEVFTDANETSPGIYTLPPAVVCDDDAECAADFAKLELRIAVSERDGALVFAIQVDKNHDEPLVVTLEHARLAATLDLAEAAQAIVTLAPLLDEDIPNLAMSGELTGAIDILGPANAKLDLAIAKALSIKVADAGVDLDGPEATRVTSEASDVLALTLDGNRRTAGLALDLGATTVHFVDDRALDVDLPGITAVATFTAGQPLTLTHVGLGERSTTVSVDGQRAITIDLDPQDGRAFDATVTADSATGLETIAVTPRLDLRFAVDHAVLGDERPVYDVTQVVLDGSIRGGDGSDRIEVTSGVFTITTDPAEFGFFANAGQCVSSVEAEDATSGAFYTQWSVGSCQ